MGILDAFFLAVSFFGSELFVLVALAYAFCWRREYGLRIAFATLITIYITLLLKLFFRIPRPEPELWKTKAYGYSFPSGHSSISACFWGYTAKHFDSLFLRLFSPAIILLVGISRVYLGVHRWEDVIAGWALGLCVALTFDAVYEKITSLISSTQLRLLVSLIVFASLYALTYALGNPTEYDYQQALKVLSLLAGLTIALIATPNTYLDMSDAETLSSIMLRGNITLLILIVSYICAKTHPELVVPMFLLMGILLVALIPWIIRRAKI